MTKENNGWVKTSVQLPKTGKEVLIFVSGFLGDEEYVDVAVFNSKTNEFESRCYFYDVEYVTHWQPLPAKPKGE